MLIVSVSCAKNDNTDMLISNAILTWTGDYELDGCGYFIVIDNYQYKPENEDAIDDSFKSIVEILVTVKYQKLDKQITTYCFNSQPNNQHDAIKIISISKR